MDKFPSTEGSAVNIEVRLSDDEDAYIIKNLWSLYQHDVSEFGVLCTCAEQSSALLAR